MSAQAEEQLRSALQASQDINRAQQALTEESRQVLVGMIRGEMQGAVADGIKEAMTPDAARLFWGVGLDMLQEQARMRAGRFVLDGIWKMLKNGFWVALLLAALYSLAGSSFAIAVWKAISPWGAKP
jgi:hypothetical protein